MSTSNSAIKFAERGLLPDALIRAGIRKLNKARLEEIAAENCEAGMAHLTRFIASMNKAEIAPVPELANAQHYEIPSEFFHYCLGKHRKYSSCFWLPDTQNLDEAEALALSQTCDHADLRDGQHILELGCGWGSLSLYMAAKFPNARITGVSNSNSQREYIMATAKTAGINNLNIITADMNVFEAAQTYDRIVSVEMFEHMRNYQASFLNIFLYTETRLIYLKCKVMKTG
jgi:cyclopropane-fatty-acyl-phospholipid synthase